MSSTWCGRSQRPIRRRAMTLAWRRSPTEVHRLRCWLDSIDAAVVARRRELASAGGRRSFREADVVSERATVCAAMPEVHAAMAAGTLSAGHADAIARAANRLDDDERVELAAMAPELVAQAASTSVDTFARKVRDLARRISRDEGLRHHEKLRSQRAVRRWTGPRRHVPHPDQPRPRSRRPALSGVRRRRRRRDEPSPTTAAASTSSAPTPSCTSSPRRRCRDRGGRPSSSCSATCETMQHGLHETSVCETYDGQPLPPATVRRLACEAEHHPDRVGRRPPRRRRRTSQTPRHRRSTTSTPGHAPHLRRPRLPRPLRRLRHPPPQGVARRRADRTSRT